MRQTPSERLLSSSSSSSSTAKTITLAGVESSRTSDLLPSLKELAILLFQHPISQAPTHGTIARSRPWAMKRGNVEPQHSEGSALDLGRRSVMLMRAGDVLEVRGCLCFVVNGCSCSLNEPFRVQPTHWTQALNQSD
jgi:hypothetical protein